MNTLRRRLAHLRHNQDGFSLPEVIISVMINGLVLTIIASALMTFLATQSYIETSSKRTTEAGLVDTAWRADATEATSVHGTDSTLIDFVAPNADGTCRTTQWTMGTATILRTITNYPSTDQTTATCTGTAGTPVVQELVTDAAAGGSYAYKNIAGRTLTFAAGAPTLADQSVPAGVNASDWDSTSIGSVTLTATAGAVDEKPVNLYISQVTVSVPRVAAPTVTTGTPDAGSSHATE